MHATDIIKLAREYADEKLSGYIYPQTLIRSELYFLIRDAFLKGVESCEKDRDMLIRFFIFFRNNGEANIGLTIEQFVDVFLKTEKEEQK
jgi:hypothetical protein